MAYEGCEWQQTSPNGWEFGRKVRGVVRRSVAWVSYGVQPSGSPVVHDYRICMGWDWHVCDGISPAQGGTGLASLHKAIAAAEAALGIGGSDAG